MAYKIDKSQIPANLMQCSEEQVQFTAARYVPMNTKFRFMVWGDSTVTLKSTDLSGTASISNITNGAKIGQQLVISVVSSSTSSLSVLTAGTIDLNGTRVIPAGQALRLIWTGTNWVDAG